MHKESARPGHISFAENERRLWALPLSRAAPRNNGEGTQEGGGNVGPPRCRTSRISGSYLGIINTEDISRILQERHMTHLQDPIALCGANQGHIQCMLQKINAFPKAFGKAYK